MAQVTRTIQLFAMHAHGVGGQNQYASIFAALSEIEPAARQARFNDLIVAIPDIRQIRNNFAFQAIIADPEAKPIVFNRNRGTASPADLRESEAIGAVTHALVDPDRRRAAIEYVKRGPKKRDDS